MTSIDRRQVPAVLGWGGVAAVMIAPVVIAAFSPYLESRSVPYKGSIARQREDETVIRGACRQANHSPLITLAALSRKRQFGMCADQLLTVLSETLPCLRHL